MATVIDGRKLAKELNQQTKERVAKLASQGIQPGIVVILVGEDPASVIYTRNKQRKAEKLGIKSILKKFPADVDQETVMAAVDQYNQDDTIDAILVQEPLPDQLDGQAITNAIRPDKDVDGLHPTNLGKLYANQPGNYPVACTPRGIMTMLNHHHVELAGKNATIVGRSILVGKPMAALLNNVNATTTLASRHTRDLATATRQADILVSAVGKGNCVTASMVKDGAVVIDVAMNRNDAGKLCGDVDFDAVEPKASYITPVPGGVGPMTRAMLMENLLTAVRNHLDV